MDGSASRPRLCRCSAVVGCRIRRQAFACAGWACALRHKLQSGSAHPTHAEQPLPQPAAATHRAPPSSRLLLNIYPRVHLAVFCFSLRPPFSILHFPSLSCLVFLPDQAEPPHLHRVDDRTQSPSASPALLSFPYPQWPLVSSSWVAAVSQSSLCQQNAVRALHKLAPAHRATPCLRFCSVLTIILAPNSLWSQCRPHHLPRWW